MPSLHEELQKLNNQYFLAGNYIIDFPKNFNKELTMHETYNGYLEAYILEGVVNVTLLDIPIEVKIQQPLKQVHRYEFEEHFGFGDHCKGFDSNKKIVLCPKYPIVPFEELFAKLNLDAMTNVKVTELCLLMILGGYWNKKRAVTDLLTFLQYNIKTDDVFESLFQKYLVTD
jgi:hypothetical protein